MSSVPKYGRSSGALLHGLGNRYWVIIAESIPLIIIEKSTHYASHYPQRVVVIVRLDSSGYCGTQSIQTQGIAVDTRSVSDTDD